jgi:hypothetical protein
MINDLRVCTVLSVQVSVLTVQVQTAYRLNLLAINCFLLQQSAALLTLLYKLYEGTKLYA